MVTTLPVLLNSLLYAFLGMAFLVIGFIILDILTPGKLWEQINEKQNLAVAIFSGAMAIGLSIIIASAIHG
jgi:uncharacterized membrane protein YjfL (UPF0719 family)